MYKIRFDSQGMILNGIKKSHFSRYINGTWDPPPLSRFKFPFLFLEFFPYTVHCMLYFWMYFCQVSQLSATIHHHIPALSLSRQYWVSSPSAPGGQPAWMTSSAKTISASLFGSSSISALSSWSLATISWTRLRANLLRDIRPSRRCMTSSQWSSRSGLDNMV